MRKLLSVALTVATTSLIPAAVAHAAEYDCAAKTCSEVLLRCYHRCPKPGSDMCNTFCPSEYPKCLQTGDFYGKFYTHHGLIRT